jgi:hypothetical protein
MTMAPAITAWFIKDMCPILAIGAAGIGRDV